MKLGDFNWENNNILLHFNEVQYVGITVDDVKEFKEKIDNTKLRFLHIGNEITINLDLIRFITYKSAETDLSLSDSSAEGR